MGASTGKQYLEKLNAMTPELDICGEKVTSKVAERSIFRNNAMTYAQLFDLQHDPQHLDKLTYWSPTRGNCVDISFLIPRGEGDLRRQRDCMNRMGSGF